MNSNGTKTTANWEGSKWTGKSGVTTPDFAHTEKTIFPFLSCWMGFDRGDIFPFDFEPNWNPLDLKSKGKLSPRSYSIQCEKKWKYSFLSVNIICYSEYIVNTLVLLQNFLFLCLNEEWVHREKVCENWRNVKTFVATLLNWYIPRYWYRYFNKVSLKSMSKY